MPQVTVTINVTQEQLMQLLGGSVQTKPASVKVAVKAKPQGPPPLTIENVSRYVNADVGPGEQKITDAGMALIWKLYRSGHSIGELGRAFSSVLNRSSISRLIKKIEASK
jgi:hypothetical protein